jgi:hypothetical protein
MESSLDTQEISVVLLGQLLQARTKTINQPHVRHLDRLWLFEDKRPKRRWVANSRSPFETPPLRLCHVRRLAWAGQGRKQLTIMVWATTTSWSDFDNEKHLACAHQATE